MDKKIFMIAGPNGSGKTTNAKAAISSLLDIYEFINADEIAKGLAPLHPEKVTLIASKLMVNRLKVLLHEQRNIAFETTAAGINYVKYLTEAKKNGYKVNLLYLWLSSPELAVKRVAKRVEQGGHNIPEDVIRRRYSAGIKNLLKHYLSIADFAVLLDNSSDAQREIAIKDLNGKYHIKNEEVWKEMQVIANA